MKNKEQLLAEIEILSKRRWTFQRAVMIDEYRRWTDHLRGMWIDHVPTVVSLNVLRIRGAWERVLERGHDFDGNPIDGTDVPWDKKKWSGYTADLFTNDKPTARHPGWECNGIVMPDEWFEHPTGNERPPRTIEKDGTLRREDTDSTGYVTGKCCTGHAYHGIARELPRLWARGPLETEIEIQVANDVMREVLAPWMWHDIVREQGWSVRRAAEIAREANAWTGVVVHWTNVFAQRPEEFVAPPTREESAIEIKSRCTAPYRGHPQAYAIRHRRECMSIIKGRGQDMGSQQTNDARELVTGISHEDLVKLAAMATDYQPANLAVPGDPAAQRQSQTAQEAGTQIRNDRGPQW